MAHRFLLSLALFTSVFSSTWASAALQQEKTPEAKAQQLAREVEEKVAELRGLPYLNPTAVGVHDVEALRKFLTQELDKELTPEVADKHQRAMVMLGLYDRDTDLRASALRLLSEQIAGFYNPSKKELFLVRRAANDAAGLEMDKVIMTHELVHALQDQHFDLSTFLSAIAANDDKITARKSLVEGDATWLMTAYQYGLKQTKMIMGMGSMVPDDIAGLKPQIEMAKKMGMKGPGGDGLNMDALMAVPIVDGDEMIFCYYGGAKFCNHLIKKGGVKAMDLAFKRPPQSTEQILHPKKYDVEYDAPQAVEIPDLAQTLGNQMGKITGNTLGELRLRSWLTDFGFKGKERSKIHGGWDGDSYVVYGGDGLADLLVWVSVWDSSQDAAEFSEAALKNLSKMESMDAEADQTLTSCGLRSGVLLVENRVYYLRHVPVNKWLDVCNILRKETKFTDESSQEEKKK